MARNILPPNNEKFLTFPIGGSIRSIRQYTSANGTDAIRIVDVKNGRNKVKILENVGPNKFDELCRYFNNDGLWYSLFE